MAVKQKSIRTVKRTYKKATASSPVGMSAFGKKLMEYRRRMKEAGKLSLTDEEVAAEKRSRRGGFYSE